MVQVPPPVEKRCLKMIMRRDGGVELCGMKIGHVGSHRPLGYAHKFRRTKATPPSVVA